MMSLLFIVRVRNFRPDNGWLITIYSKLLPNDVRVQKSFWCRTPPSYTTCLLFGTLKPLIRARQSSDWHIVGSVLFLI